MLHLPGFLVEGLVEFFQSKRPLVNAPREAIHFDRLISRTVDFGFIRTAAGGHNLVLIEPLARK